MERLNKKWKTCHGHRGDRHWEAPILAARSDEANRPKQGNKIKANEYLDEPHVLEAKMKLIAQLIKNSSCVVAYTGAGLSRAAGIPDYATKSKNSVSIAQPAKKISSLECIPTFSHHALAAMERNNLLHHYVQQNHDGLPQKAGFPQHKMNEIHGAWFDPANPVVQFSGNLRDDLFSVTHRNQWMEEMEQRTDLCLCLGTSLSGMNADRMAETPAERMVRGEDVTGTVIINLQRTHLDNQCAVRVWAKLDDAFALLCQYLEIDPSPIIPPRLDRNKFVIPYDENGLPNAKCRMTLDLTIGAPVCIPNGPAPNAGARGKVSAKDQHGNWSVSVDKRRKLGRWWIIEALNGTAPYIPVVNCAPEIEWLE